MGYITQDNLSLWTLFVPLIYFGGKHLMIGTLFFIPLDIYASEFQAFGNNGGISQGGGYGYGRILVFWWDPDPEFKRARLWIQLPPPPNVQA